MVRYIEDSEDNASTLHEPAPSAYLVLLAKGRFSQSFPLRGEVNLGRDKSNSVVVSDQKVSRYHAGLTPVGDAFIVTDKGSANGTYLNGVLITQPVRLKDMDHITIGDTHFLFNTTVPDPNAIDQLVSLVPSISSPAPPQKPSLPTSWLEEKSIWMVVGCLGLVIVGLLLVLALLIGLFLGRGQAAELSGLVWSTALLQQLLLAANTM